MVRAIPCLILALWSAFASCQEPASALLRPPNHLARKYRIGYVETKTFANYAATLAGLAFALKDLGWLSSLDGLPYDPRHADTRAMWTWLSSHATGPSLEFPADAYYTYQGLDGPGIKRAAAPIIRRLRDRKDLDLVIAMGTDAGKTLATDAHKTPVLVFSTSDAVRAGVIKSAQDPGRNHVWAHMDPDRYRRQIEIFHDIFRFRKLGVAYEDSRAGRTFAAVDDLEAVARERGFQVVREFVTQPAPGHMDKFYQDLALAHRRLAAKVDAAYFGLFIGIQPERLPELFTPFVERKLPVFAQQGPDDVRHGALMSVARADFRGIGRFGAEVVAQVLNGVSPRKLGQVYENSPNIILNLEVARAIGYKPTFDILLVADEIFHHVEREAPTKARKP